MGHDAERRVGELTLVVMGLIFERITVPGGKRGVEVINLLEILDLRASEYSPAYPFWLNSRKDRTRRDRSVSRHSRSQVSLFQNSRRVRPLLMRVLLSQSLVLRDGIVVVSLRLRQDLFTVEEQDQLTF